MICFLTTGAPGSPECRHNLDVIIQMLHILGIPLAIEKVVGSITILDFLSIILDTMKKEARFPDDKLYRVRYSIAKWLVKKKAIKREISLVVSLQHAAEVVQPGLSSVSCMYSTVACVRFLHLTQSRIPFQFILVTHLPSMVEWCEHFTVMYHEAIRHHSSNWPIQKLGLQDIMSSTMVSMGKQPLARSLTS